MTYQFSREVAELVRKQMATGQYDSEEQLLLSALQSLEAENQDWLAVKESIDTLDQGEQSLSLDEAFDSLRTKHEIPKHA